MPRAAALVLLSGCQFAATQEDWQSQLEPAGPCYEANLLDGLDTTSTDEAHAVFDCLNAYGALDAYAPLDESLDAETRDGLVGIVLAEWLANLPSVDLSMGDLLDGVMSVLDDPSGLFDGVHLGLELVYGKPWPWLGSSVELNSQTALDDGLLVPGVRVAAVVATDLLDSDLASLPTWVDVLASDEVTRAIWSIGSIGVSTDSTLAGLRDRLPADLADARARAQDTDNDRWSEASGDSMRDLADALFAYEADDRLTLDYVAEAAAPLLEDERLRDALAVDLQEAADAGRLDTLPAQVRYLATVDARGGSLSDGEASALTALIRLLHDANTSVDCSIDLVFFDVDFSFGNLSVSLLELLAEQDPDTVDSGVGLLGDLLGVSLTDDILDAVADSGVCPVIDAQMVEDLHSVDRLADPQTDELLYVLLDVLATTHDLDHVDALVDTVAQLQDRGLMPPLEEAVLDLGDGALAEDLMGLVPVLLDPWAFHDATWFDAAVTPIDFDMAWGVAASVLAVDGSGSTALADVAGPLRAALAQDDTWTVVDRAITLFAEPDAVLQDALPWVGAWCESDPALGARDTAVDLLGETASVRPLLVLLEAEAPREALIHTEILTPGPIPFTAELVHGGTLERLLDTLRLLATLLPEEDG